MFVDGQPIDEAGIDYFQYFTLGNTHMAVGPADARWPVREFPEFRLDVPTAEPEEEEESPEAIAEDGDEQESEDQESHRPPRRRLILMTAALTLFLLVNVGAGYAVIGGNWFAGTEGIDNDELEKELQQVIHELAPDGGVTLSRLAKGFHVQGFVMSADERGKLEHALRDVERGISFRVWNTEQLADSVREVLGVLRLDRELRALPGGPGEVVVSGQLLDLLPWQSAERRIRHDVPVLAKLTDAVVKFDPTAPRAVPRESSLPAMFRRDPGQYDESSGEPNLSGGPLPDPWLPGQPGQRRPKPGDPDQPMPKAGPSGPYTLDSDLAGRSSYNPVADGTSSGGPNGSGRSGSRSRPYGSSQLQPSTANRTQSRREFVTVRKPSASASGSSEDAPVILPMQSIRVGQGQSITLEDGQRIFVGAVLENGYRLKSIEPDKIVLTRNGTERHVVMGDINYE